MKDAQKTLKKAPSPVIGVIAEYDPFHNGHALHLERARETLGLDANTAVPVITALSSSFTQRGLPSFAGKTARAKMALANGANLVLELPFVHACNSAQEFARGGLEILAATQLVTHLAFGAEDAAAFNEPLFENLPNILVQEPFSFKLNLRKNLSAGCSYPKAFALAMERELPGTGHFFSSPNNVLAVSYIAEIRRKGHHIIPVPIQREGSAHNDDTPGRGAASASALRKALSDENWEREDAAWVSDALPGSVMSMLKEERDNGRLCRDTDKLWSLLRGLLLRSSPYDIGRCAGMEEGLENLFLKHYAKACSFDDFIGRCVCARYTRARLRRQVIRCLVGLDRWTEKALLRSGPPYIRVLGYDDVGLGLLRLLKKREKPAGAAAPVITRLSEARGGAAKKAADAEYRASRLRELLLPNPDLTGEEKIIPIAWPGHDALWRGEAPCHPPKYASLTLES